MENFFNIKHVKNVNIIKNKLESNTIYQNNFAISDKNNFIHKDLYLKLNNLVNKPSKYLDSIFLYGKDGVGKFNCAKYLIKEYINNNIVNDLTKLEYENDSKILKYKKSKFHYEIIIDNYNFSDYNLISEFLKEITIKDLKTNENYKKNIIILKNVHLLRLNIIKLLKNYIEKNYILNSFILISNKNINKELEGLMIKIQVPIPDKNDFIKLGKYILKKRNIDFKKQELQYIYSISENSLNKFKNILELSYINNNYEKFIDVNDDKLKFIYKILKKNDFQYVGMIREILNDLTVDNYDYKKILNYIIIKIIKEKNLEKNKINRILKLTIECDINIQKSYRLIHHLEYLFISIINIFNN